jgi:transposase-like protein
MTGAEHATPSDVADNTFLDEERLLEAERNRIEYRRVPLEEITFDSEIQVRIGDLDEAYVDELSQVLINGGRYRDPIVLFRSEDGSAKYLADGFNRCSGMERALQVRQDVEPLDAEIRPGGREAAIEYAEEANLQHGKLLTPEERFGIFERRIKRGHAWVSASNRSIAAALKVSESTIRNWRKRLEEQSGAQNCAPEHMFRVGKDGKEYNVSVIQDTSQRRAEERAQLEAEIDEMRQRIIAELKTGPLGWAELGERVGDASDPTYELALDDLLKTQQIARYKSRDGRTFVQFVGSGMRLDEDVIHEARERILDALIQGPLSPVELRQALHGVPTIAYEVARDALYTEGMLQGDQDVRSGRILYSLAAPQRNDGSPDQMQNAPDAALPAHEQFAHLGIDAHSQSHDPNQVAAYRLRAQLEKAALDALDALERLLQIRGVRLLYLLSHDEMAETDDLLHQLLDYVWDEEAGDNPTAYHIRALREKMAIMDETGLPYDAALDEEG